MTPRGTPARGVEARNVTSPIRSVLNSPDARERIIQEYDRRIANERSHSHHLQELYETACTHSTRLENDLKERDEEIKR